MKKQIKTGMIAGFLVLLSWSAAAQDTPAWVSQKGYWIVEGNIHTPLRHSIRFYNNQHVLIGSKEINGVKLNVRKRKTRMMLKEALETSLLGWEKNKDSKELPVLAGTAP